MMRPLYEKSKQQKIKVWFIATSKQKYSSFLTLVTSKKYGINVDFSVWKVDHILMGSRQKGVNY